jgi:hypothetical protein
MPTLEPVHRASRRIARTAFCANLLAVLVRAERRKRKSEAKPVAQDVTQLEWEWGGDVVPA